MILDLEPNEFEFLINVLGELPTKSGAFILLQKLNAQKVAQPMQNVEVHDAKAEATVQ